VTAPADSAPPPPSGGPGGRPASRVDGPAKVTGRARYSGEHRPKNLAYAATADAAIPAGTVRLIDTADAERAPGVLLALTHRNADRLPYRDVEPRPAVEPASGRQLRVLQDASVLFSGQPLAVVVADTQAHAEYAAGLVRIEYDADPRPVTRFAPELARPASRAAAGRGRGPRTEVGDPDAALAAACATVDSASVLPREQHNPIELFAAVAEWEGGSLTLWSKTQWVGNERDTIAAVFGIPATDVHVISPYVGGAFGAALRTWPHVTLAAIAARRAGRPVRLELTRRQMYTSTGFRPHTLQRVALGADQRGRLQAHVQDAVGQTSTYEEFAEATLDAAQKTYAAASRRTTYRLARMHTNTPGPMRGPGHATGLVAQEIAMDELAVILGLDPIELRLRNFAERDAAKDLPWTSNQLRDCYRVGAERFGWARRPLAPRSMSAGGELAGLGMATAMNTSPRYPARASATVYADGTAVVRSATSDMGPGTYTSMTQLAADALRLPVSRVRFELGDSALPQAQEHGGSTTLASVGSAVRAVCAELRRRLDDLAAQHGCDPADAAGVLRQARADQLAASGGAQPGGEQTTHSAYSFGAVFAEVRVDPDLCEIRVPRMLGVYDIGRVVNPRLARSQVIGGMTGGLGMALLEDTEWDERHGRVINANLAEYLIPVCADVRDLDVTFLPGHDPVANPLGTKGVAELGLCGVAPAIANAVWHATGIRTREMPITLDKLLTASHPHPA
jgi:xanthine dehydrogenase YagR molybdenum-binding subunit